MKKTKVSIVKADNYNYAEVYAAVSKSIQLIGGLAGIVAAGSKVFVKINHLSPPSPAEKGVVTHPVLVAAVLDLLKEIGADITVGDDIQADGDGFLVSGFRQMCQQAGVRLINLRETGFAETACNGHFLEKIYLAKTVAAADVIINLPKLKTHSLCIFTGAVKNLYGTVPTSFRRKFHAEYFKNENFSQAVTDIFSVSRPQLTIMDGIIAMEGEGPAGGNLRKLGVILAGRDAVAVDAVATKIIGFSPLDIYTTRYSSERGLGTANLQDIELIGEEIGRVTVADFKPPSSAIDTLAGIVPRQLPGFILRQFSTRPNVIKRLCSECAECQQICPVGAISVNSTAAKIDYDTCIKCMCCHEVCRFDAIVPRQPIAGSTILGLVNLLRKLRVLAAGNR